MQIINLLKERSTTKKRANLNEGHFGLLRNTHHFQKLNKNGMKNAEKELTIRLIAHITYKKYIEN